MSTNKSIFKSKIFWSSVILFIIGIEPYIPTIQTLLPEPIGAIFAIVLPAVIGLARLYMTFDKKTEITNDDVVELVENKKSEE